MLFSSLTFLLVFLPCVLLVYFLAPKAAKNMVLFAFEDIGKGWAFFRTMFGGAAFCDTAALYRLVSYLPLLLLCALAATPLGAKLYRKCSGRCAEGLMTAFDVTGLAVVAGLAVAFLIGGSYNPFLYFRF